MRQWRTASAADEATILRSWPLVSSNLGVMEPDLSIVGVATSGSRHCRGHLYPEACQDPGSLTRGQARWEQSVVDLACDGEAVKCGWWEKQPRIVRETVRGGIDVALGRRDDAVVIRVHARHFSGIGIEQSPLEILHIGLEGGRSFIDVQIDFVGETARNTALTKFPLRIHSPVKLVGIAGKSGIIANDCRVVVDPSGSGPRNDGLQLPDLTILKGVRCLAKGVGEATCKGQFVEGMYPVCSQIIEFPVGVGVALLQGIVGAHAFIDRYDISLFIWEMIGLAWEVCRPPVGGENRARDVVVVAHRQELFGILCGEHSELSVGVAAWRGYGRHREIVNHPTFVPATFVIDDEQR